LKKIGHANLVDGLYRIIEEKDQCCVNNMTSFKTSVIDLWHDRLGHPSNEILDNICKNNNYIHYNQSNICEYCYYVKQRRLSFKNSESITLNAFDLVHVDIWGPFSIISVHGHKYFLTIVDDFSRYTWIFL